MGKIVGIDLGTTTSAIAVYENGKPRVIADADFKTDEGFAPRIIPTAVYRASLNSQYSVGYDARDRVGCAREFKRQMGEDIGISLGAEERSPEELSALVLRHLLDSAERDLGERPERAVITVPANWKNEARQATKNAGRLAGLEVERLINEPTAAAIAYGIRPDTDGKTIAVYDLGGGTFDVTILEIEDRVFNVRTSVGDPKLGGSDFDRLLAEHVLAQQGNGALTLEKLGKLPGGEKSVHALKLQCEKAKKTLSRTRTASVRAPFVIPGQPAGIDVDVSRATLIELIDPLVQRSIEYVHKALRNANLKPGDIDTVVLAGGSTRIPHVRALLSELFGQEPDTSLNPDEAITLGAATQAWIMESEPTADSPLVLDNVNSTLGVEVVGEIGGVPVEGLFSPILAKDKKVPCRHTESYWTLHDQQECISIEVFEGEDRFAKNNRKVSPLPVEIDGLPRKPAGEVKIDITMGLTIDGTVDVEVAIEGEPRHSGAFQLVGSHYSALELERKRRELDESWKTTALGKRYGKLLDSVQLALETPRHSTHHGALSAALAELESAIQAGDEPAAESADLKLTDVMFDLDD